MRAKRAAAARRAARSPDHLFNPTHSSVTVCPITSECVDAPLFRVTLPPGDRTGLTTASQVMIDKAMSVKRERVGSLFGRLDDEAMLSITRSLAVFLGIG